MASFESKEISFSRAPHSILKSIIHPIFIYVILFWVATLKHISRKFLGYRKEHHHHRVILDYNVEDSSQAMDTLKILSIYDRLYLGKAKFMYKVYQRITPDYISEQFTLRNNVNISVNLRSATACCFIPPKPRTEYYKHSLRYSGCLVWKIYFHQQSSYMLSEHFRNSLRQGLINFLSELHFKTCSGN